MSITFICILIIILTFLGELIAVSYFKAKHKIVTYKRIVDYFPTSLSTMGVLGTFIGIYIGLQEFDPRNIQASIPVLLDGLKTAFLTSLWGMGLSLLFSYLINILTDLDEKYNPTEFDKLAVKISESVDKMSKNVVRSMDRVRQQIDVQTQNIQSNHTDAATTAEQISALRAKVDKDMTGIRSTVEEMQEWFQGEFLEKFEGLAIDVGISTTKLSKSEEYLDNISDEETNRSQMLKTMLHSTIEEVQTVMKECNAIFQEKLLEGEKMLQSNIANGREQTKQLMEACNKQIADKMEECDRIVLHHIGQCNQMLDQKLDVFGKSIAKSNTEALSEVMESACLNFQMTMNSLLGQLVKENFQGLNDNIVAINRWQATNMKQMELLTSQCTNVIEELNSSAKNQSAMLKENTERLVADLVNFSHSMTSDIHERQISMLRDVDTATGALEKVAVYTESISSAEGELGKLVKALRSVVIDDKSFVNVTKLMTNSIDTNAKSVNYLNTVAATLNGWVSSNKQMQSELHSLITKLDELNKFRDFNDGFWLSTKTRLEEGISVLKDGSKELNKQLANIDRHFYERLTVTMANLDECLSKMVESKDN